MTTHESGDCITLRGMTFHTLIGVLPHEREHAQPVEVDLIVRLTPGSGILDYRRLYSHVRSAMDSPSLYYLEELGSSIADRVLEEQAINRVHVAIRKPHAALGGPLESVEVSLTRERNA